MTWIRSGGSTVPAALVPHAWWFGEDQARYVVTVPDSELLGVLTKLKTVDVPVTQIGKTGGRSLVIEGEGEIAVAKLRHAFEHWLPAYMGGQG